jgi:hypothetical protein
LSHEHTGTSPALSKEELPLQLAEATSLWISYKRKCGFGQLLSESMLLMPLAEFLMGQGWTVASEQDLYTVAQKGSPGAVNYDLVAGRSADELQAGRGQIILEVKSLTKKSNYPARIYSDFAKLALAPGHHQCISVVAFEEGMAQLPPGLRGENFTFRASGEHRPLITDGDVRNSIAKKLKQHDLDELSFDVRTVAEKNNVIVFSISNSVERRSAEATASV